MLSPKTFAAAAALLSVANAAANSSTPIYTEVVTAVTTYCPSAMSVTFGSRTYAVTEATTLTITDCPCTLTHSKPVVAPTPMYRNATMAPYTTEVVNSLTTYCPSPTVLTFGSKTYEVSTPTSLTITDCPCTITKSNAASAPPAAATTAAGTTAAAAGTTAPAGQPSPAAPASSAKYSGAAEKLGSSLFGAVVLGAAAVLA